MGRSSFIQWLQDAQRKELKLAKVSQDFPGLSRLKRCD